jgi:hypothetical protein
MRRQTYEEAAKRLESLCDRLDSAGFSKLDRIRIQVKSIRELAEAQRQGTLDALAADIDHLRRRELMWSFVEGFEFADALASLEEQGSSIPRDVLERALNGPAYPTSENDSNNIGRNTTFEVVLAGDLAAAGLKPTLGSEPDIIVEFSGRRLMIACKRPLSSDTVSTQIKMAAKQLGRRLENEGNPRDCGLVAISATRAFTTGEKWLEVSREIQVRDYLDEELSKLIRQHEQVWRKIKSPKIAGLLFHISTPGEVLAEKLLITAAHTLIVHIEGKSDAALLEDLGRLMQKKGSV